VRKEIKAYIIHIINSQTPNFLLTTSSEIILLWTPNT